MKSIFLVTLVAMFFVACEKKEVPVAPATSQALIAGMGDDYLNMLYFNVNTGLFVKQMPHTGYSLQFKNAESSKHVYLNSSNFMFVRNFGQVPFASVTDTTSAALWKYDFPDGDENRTAFGRWFDENGITKNNVYVVNLGYNELGNSLGFLKMQVKEANATSYAIRVSDLNNSFDTTAIIYKDAEKDQIQFSLLNFAIEDIEPNKTDWHLHFTQATDYDITDQGDTIPYLVRSVLINQTNTEVARLENVEFDALKKDDVKNLNYSNAKNAIGFNWKSFSLVTGIYEVLPNLVYIIKENSGNYYKLRFVEYYNDQGEKGYAKFEIIAL